MSKLNSGSLHTAPLMVVHRILLVSVHSYTVNWGWGDSSYASALIWLVDYTMLLVKPSCISLFGILFLRMVSANREDAEFLLLLRRDTHTYFVGRVGKPGLRICSESVFMHVNLYPWKLDMNNFMDMDILVIVLDNVFTRIEVVYP